jgi:hypothetical protein
MAYRCPAPLDDGSPCSRPASVWDASRGAFVCEAQAPAPEPYRRCVVTQKERAGQVLENALPAPRGHPGTVGMERREAGHQSLLTER